MTMAGFRGWYEDRLEGEIQSFLAGVDILLWPSYQYMDTLEARITRGEIPMERLDDAVGRVWAMKERFGLLSPDRKLLRALTADEQKDIKKASREITESSITLVRDIDKKLPLSPEKDKKILLVAVTPVAKKGNDRETSRPKSTIGLFSLWHVIRILLSARCSYGMMKHNRFGRPMRWIKRRSLSFLWEAPM